MANKVLVFIEQRSGQIKKASLEGVKVGSEIAAKLGLESEAILIGGEVENPESIGKFGITKCTYFKNAELENYSSSAYTELVEKYVNESDPDIIIFSNSSLGKDLAPRVAARLNCGIAVDVVGIEYDNNEIIATRPVYAGKALMDVKISSPKKIFTLRPNVFNLGEPSDQTADVEIKEVDAPNLAVKVVDLKKSEGKIDVAEAETIVAGGRGLKEADKFKMIEDLAEELNAAVGASRAVVDAGWRPHSEQVGQTGKTVSPTLYIAVGISGAIQHLAGMRSSKYIVAINKDAEAPIFQIADYGIAGDAFEILPALIEEVKKVKSS